VAVLCRLCALITSAREFVFANPARLHTALNPDFFKGTVVDDAVAKLTRSGSVPPSSSRSGH
jgi:hypothetical protein